jgi:RHS repeat-associated protein
MLLENSNSGVLAVIFRTTKGIHSAFGFGMQMPGRNGGEDYRYAFNGMEHDPEVSGDGNSYTTEFRGYDPRLGRWKSLDPLMAKFPHSSPYVGFADNPIIYIDPYGLEPVNGDGLAVTLKAAAGGGTKHYPDSNAGRKGEPKDAWELAPGIHRHGGVPSTGMLPLNSELSWDRQLPIGSRGSSTTSVGYSPDIGRSNERSSEGIYEPHNPIRTVYETTTEVTFKLILLDDYTHPVLESTSVTTFYEAHIDPIGNIVKDMYVSKVVDVSLHSTFAVLDDNYIIDEYIGSGDSPLNNSFKLGNKADISENLMNRINEVFLHNQHVAAGAFARKAMKLDNALHKGIEEGNGAARQSQVDRTGQKPLTVPK